MFLFSQYLSHPLATCFDNEPNDPPQDPPQDPPKNPPNDPGEKVLRLTQSELNAMMAENKKTLRANLEQAEAQVKTLSEKYSLTTEEKSQMEENLENMRRELMTAEERAKEDQKKLKTSYESQIEELTKRTTSAENRYNEAILTRALKDAAVLEDGHDPDQFVAILYNKTKLVDNKPMVDLPVLDEDTGEEKVLFLSPVEAVKKMKEMPRFANLFKSNVVGGVGVSSNTGIFGPGNDGRIDPTKIKSMDEYRKHRAEILKAKA